MKVGFIGVGIGAGTDAESIKTIAIHAERLDFATLWAPEHVVLVEGYKSRYPYSQSGEVMGRSRLAPAQPLGRSYLCGGVYQADPAGHRGLPGSRA